VADGQTAALIAKAKRDNEYCPRRGDHSNGCGCEPTTAYLLAKALEASEARVTTLHKSLQEAKCGVPTAHDDSSPGIAAPVAQQSAGACKIVPDTSADWGVSCAVHGEEYTRVVCAAPETKSLDADHPGPSAAQAELGDTDTRPDEGAGPSESVRHAARRESRDAGLSAPILFEDDKRDYDTPCYLVHVEARFLSRIGDDVDWETERESIIRRLRAALASQRSEEKR